MKNTKKIAVIMIVAILCLATALCCVACDNDTNPDNGDNSGNNGGGSTQTFEIKMWVSEKEGVKEQFQSQVEAFNASQSDYKIVATISGVSEGEAATQMIADVESGADLFCFAQDQLTRLVQAGALQYLGNAAKEAVTEANDASAVACATVGDKIYAYPLTADNGYFMYYDKSVVKESSLESLDAILADCNAAEKSFSFNVGGSGWYSASFFFGAGCVSEWTTPDGKTFTGINDTYNTDKGLIAMKGLSAFMNNKAYKDSQETSDFQLNSAVVISGTWDVTNAKKALGDNYGVAKLPKYTVDGESYQLGSYTGSKLLGLKPQTNLERAKALQALATYLTNEENQLARYTEFGWGPSNKNAQANEAVKADVALGALAEQNVHATPQGNIPGSWWDITKTLAAGALAANGNETALKAALVAYNDAISALADPDYVPGQDATVIGNMYGDTNWTIDHPMTSAQGIWTTDYPIYLEEGAEFKVRLGKTWDNGEFGNGGANYVVEKAGLYWIKANVENKTIELVEAVMGVCGDYNNWGETADTALVWDSEKGAMTATVTSDAGKGLKVRMDAGWALNWGTTGIDGDNYTTAEAGDYVVTMSFDKVTLSWSLSVAKA